jgi:hypothetical protein
MSRQRARVFRGPGYKEAPRSAAFVARQRLRSAQRAVAAPVKLSLAERVIPWRRRKLRKQRTQHRERSLSAVREAEAKIGRAEGRRRVHRSAWRSITTARQRALLHNIGLKVREGDEAPTYDHPQRRRMEREMRIQARYDAQDEKYGTTARA